jgi:hypothetical protein
MSPDDEHDFATSTQAVRSENAHVDQVRRSYGLRSPIEVSEYRRGLVALPSVCILGIDFLSLQFMGRE